MVLMAMQKRLASELCQINEVQTPGLKFGTYWRASELCQINEVQTRMRAVPMGGCASELCQINAI